MPREIVETLKRALEANRSDDVEGAIEVFTALSDESTEYRSIMGAVEPKLYRGPRGTRQYFRDLAESFEEWQNEVEEIYELRPNTVFATIRTRIVGKGSGVPVEARLAFVCELSDGKVVRGGTYLTREEALEAVGLSE